MSTILKALKKLESENEGRDEALQWLEPIRSGKQNTVHRQKGFRGIHFFVLLGVGIGVGIGIASGYHLLSTAKTPTQTVTKQTAIKSPDSDQPTTEPSDLSLQSPEAGKPKRTVDARSGFPKSIPEAQINEKNLSGKTASASMTTESAVIAGKGVDNMAVATPGKKTVKISLQNEKKKISPTPELKESDAVSPDVYIPTIADARLTLQAISWAKDPVRRFAVVNNRIVRKGQRIDAITVVAIEESAIVFREGDKQWRQLF